MSADSEVERFIRPGLLEDMEEWPVEKVRKLRDACRSCEATLSYKRRVAQGRLDIARSEQERRSRGIDLHGQDLLDALASVLTDRPSGAQRSDRALTLIAPDEDDVSEMPALLDLPELTDDELAGLVGSLHQRERELSGRRRALLDNLDRLQDELVARYRDGRADVREIIEPGTESG